MANTTTDQQGNILPLARSITPGPLFFRSPQPRRVLSGRISRRRSTSLSLTDLNRQAIWDEAILQFPSTSPTTTSAAYSLDAVPSLISSASSTPSTAAFDIFPCTESVPLDTAVTSLLEEPSLLSFDPSMEFAVPLSYNTSSYTSHYPHSYIAPISEEKPMMTSESLEQHSTYAGSYAPSPALAGTSSALPSRSASVETEQVHDYSYPTSYTYAAPTSMGPAPSYNYSYGMNYSHAETRPSSYGYPSYSQSGSSYIPTQPSYMQSHDPRSTVDPSMTQGERPKLNDPPKETRCWDHGCNGRVFSTHSNYLRHVREKSGNATKATCPHCGAPFTRKTAMRQHVDNKKCGKKSGFNTPSSRSPSQPDR
ncbi:hypothetical protein BT63DRAFT_443225 [Microthyrium microscopicum]|uniref:Uncharacterized protein n=1 Tax=Microthyrium microscopicum TaxID=703497 RepID=A0A6A6TXU5_9PEZI|nr:hypothetical protein BT63DRAFT_443225 [Microthyrium microscopicum]